MSWTFTSGTVDWILFLYRKIMQHPPFSLAQCLVLSLFSSLPSVQYEPRGPGRPLYQRRISSSYPDESSPANTHNALSQQPQPCTSDPQDHPHPRIQHHQHPHAPYGYPSHDLWPSNGGGPGPFQNIPCNGAGTLVQQRDLLGRYFWNCWCESGRQINQLTKIPADVGIYVYGLWYAVILKLYLKAQKNAWISDFK